MSEIVQAQPRTRALTHITCLEVKRKKIAQQQTGRPSFGRLNNYLHLIPIQRSS